MGLKISGVESHNSLGIVERYHDPLRRIYNTLRHVSPKIDKDIALRLAIKSMNDTVRPEGYVPSTHLRMSTSFYPVLLHFLIRIVE